MSISLNYEINPQRRIAETRVKTARNNVYLTIATSHTSGKYWSRVDRVLIENDVLSMKIDRARFQDLAPIAQAAEPTNRYSAKKLEETHQAFLDAIGQYELDEALTWAARY